MIKVIAFDLDNTLWEVDPIIMRAEASLDAWLKAEVPELEYSVATMRELREELLNNSPSLAQKITEFRRRLIELAMLKSGIDPINSEVLSKHAIEIFLVERNQIEFYPGAMEALHSLKSDFTLGALSNGNANVNRLGLGDVFSFGFSAEEVGAPKPAPDLFHAALKHTRVVPHEMLYVGDDPRLDADAAKGVGLSTVLVNTRNKPLGETEPDEIIESIDQLPGAIARLVARL